MGWLKNCPYCGWTIRKGGLENHIKIYHPGGTADWLEDERS